MQTLNLGPVVPEDWSSWPCRRAGQRVGGHGTEAAAESSHLKAQPQGRGLTRDGMSFWASKPPPSDSLPPTRPHLQILTEGLILPTGDQALKSTSLWGFSPSEHHRWCSAHCLNAYTGSLASQWTQGFCLSNSGGSLAPDLTFFLMCSLGIQPQVLMCAWQPFYQLSYTPVLTLI